MQRNIRTVGPFPWSPSLGRHGWLDFLYGLLHVGPAFPRAHIRSLLRSRLMGHREALTREATLYVKLTTADTWHYFCFSFIMS